MDSCHNSSEKLPPLFARRKRVTPHQLNKSLRKMGFRSWTSFLPGDYHAWYYIVDKSMCLNFSIMTSRSQTEHVIPSTDPFMAICNFDLLQQSIFLWYSWSHIFGSSNIINWLNLLEMYRKSCRHVDLTLRSYGQIFCLHIPAWKDVWVDYSIWYYVIFILMSHLWLSLLDTFLLSFLRKDY